MEQQSQEFEPKLAQMQLLVEQSTNEARVAHASLDHVQGELMQAQAQAEKWCAQAQALSAQMQKLTVVNEEHADATFRAQSTIQLQQVGVSSGHSVARFLPSVTQRLMQSLLAESDEREQSLRIENAELKAQLDAVQVRMNVCDCFR